MDLSYGERYEQFRRELREFLTGWPLHGAEAALPAPEHERIFRMRGSLAGYVYRNIPAEPGASKHAGISYLLVPMDAPGIDVRPLKQMTGSMEFNEVFFDDARAPAENIVGRRGEGWSISRATLKHERNLIGNPRLMTGQFDVLLQIARRATRDGRPAIEDPAVRARLAEIECYVRACETTNLRMLSAQARGEELSVVLPMMMIKLFSTEVMEQIACEAYDLLGSDGLLEPAAANDSIYDTSGTLPGVVYNYIFSLGPPTAAGASTVHG